MPENFQIERLRNEIRSLNLENLSRLENLIRELFAEKIAQLHSLLAKWNSRGEV